MLQFRLDAFNHWKAWKNLIGLKRYPNLDYQDYSYYSAPSCGSCDDLWFAIWCNPRHRVAETNNYLTAEVEEALNQLGVPVREGRLLRLTPF